MKVVQHVKRGNCDESFRSELLWLRALVALGDVDHLFWVDLLASLVHTLLQPEHQVLSPLFLVFNRLASLGLSVEPLPLV